MKTLYIRLAAEGIRRNRRFYLPFLLTAAGVSAVQYILFFLAGDVGLDKISGGATLRAILQLGSFVIAVFAALFLFYTHAFLTRRRGREFGLYSVLGMGKRSLAAILFWETLLSFAVSLSVGLLAGAALAKLAELGLYRITGGTVNYSLRLSGAGLGETTLVFGVIFLLLFLDSLRRIGFADTVTLTKSENLGEKPPRANPVLGVLGLALLGGAYALAITIQDPIAAIGLFFLAVLMVIVGTYLVFIAGSVLLCRLLQRNKRYYYKPAHFVSVSSMAFRMKRSGAGLASVCILATMVLVMISSTTCLYFGEEDVVRTRYPEDMRVEFVFWDDETTDASAADTDAVRALVLAEAAEDASRFAIMQKVGMTAREIRRSVNSQMLTVFFLPLLLAGVHLACAFPMIAKLLTLFGMYNTALFAATTGISFAVFAALYALVWRVTSGAYCDIVGGTHA